MSSGGFTTSILGHLVELRDRLTRSVIAIAITTAIAFAFGDKVFAIITFESELTRPIFDFLHNKFMLAQAPSFTLIAIELTENFSSYMKVCLVAGIIVAMPYLLYELVMFVSPALTPKEKRYVYIIFPWVSLMFIVGVIFAYFILLPPAITFLINFGSDFATPQIRVENYISVLTRLLLAVGLIFELPVLITFLARLGVVSPKWLAGQRKFALILAFVVGGIITPTFDPINQLLVSIPLILLYEISIWLAKIVYRKKKSPAPAAT